MKTINKITDELMNLPLSETEDFVKSLSQGDLAQIEKQLVTIAEKAARLNSYVTKIYQGSSHNYSVLMANIVAADVRSVLGYKITDDLNW